MTRRHCLVALLAGLFALSLAGAAPRDRAASLPTRTPIKHLIVVIGENVSFDALFATWQPPPGQQVLNLRAEGIVGADGSPGPGYGRATQYRWRSPTGRWSLELERAAPYAPLPTPSLAGVYDPVTATPRGAIADPRFAALEASGPFPITRHAPYRDAQGTETGDPVHRFFQMWQQTGGDNAELGRYAWVALGTGRGGDTPGVTPQQPGQGSELMGFYNMAAGDAPYFRELAERYALSDNFHQAIQGGTGANFFVIASGDVAVYERDGRRGPPPARQMTDPDPAPGTENFYIHDGYAGGSWVACADATQPGVAPIRAFLERAGRDAHCEPGTWYLVNNYDPPFEPDGTPVELGPERAVYPPQTLPEIGSALSAHGVSWGWYTGGRERADFADDPLYPLAQRLAARRLPHGDAAALEAATLAAARDLTYNNIGDPLTSFARVIHGPLAARLRGLAAFDAALAAGTLPAVSFVVPKNLDSGHPGYSAPARYEDFLRGLIGRVQARPGLWRSTAILVMTDEGGGYFDSGPIQPLDFFGDGPRIPFIVVSPYARRGHVDHTYQDHASVLKFIEHNWRLPPLSARSRDRLPNPRAAAGDPYRPANGPAIGDLTTLFEFGARPP